MTTVRVADLNDVPAIVKMGRRFLTEGPYGDQQPDDAGLYELAEQLLSDPSSLMLIALVDGIVVGMFAGSAYQHRMLGVKVATEIAWWLEPEYRGKRVSIQMFDRFLAWARTQGVRFAEMMAPTDKVGAFYERQGFVKFETHYRRAM